MKTFTASAIVGLAANVAAHGIVTKIVVAGTKTYEGYNPNFQYMQTPPAVIGWTAPETQDRGPVAGNALNDPDIICGKGATNAGTISAPIAAGEEISFQWTEWPVSHHGPVLDYLAPCGADCSTVDKTSLKFFKIDGVGMTGTTGSPPNFADDDMIANNNTWTVKIPSDIAPGNYVLRHETIALHEGNRLGGSQPYPQCVNLEITGSGSATPAGVLGTELYTQDEPGIHFNIYRKFTDTNEYPVPGPTLYSGGGGSGGGAAPPPATTSAAAVPTSAPAIPTRNNIVSTTSAVRPIGTGTSGGNGGSGCKVKRWHPKDFAAKA